MRTVVPSGWATSGNVVINAGVAGNQSTAVQLGLVQLEAISGFAYSDANKNATPDSGEARLAGWQLYLDRNNNGLLDSGEISVTTDSSGRFTFSSLPPGTYVVREVVKPGWVQSPAGQKYSITVTSSVVPPTLSFGNVQVYIPGALSVTLFNDANGDGVRQATEQELDLWQIYLDANNNGKLDSGETSALTRGGVAQFANLKPGTYLVREVLNTNYRVTTPPAVSVVIAGGKTATASFGNQMLSGINGFVYNDINGNAARDSSDPPLAGVKVFLDLNLNGIFDANEPATLSSSTGAYSFTRLAPGTYQVIQIPPAGFVTMGPPAGKKTISPIAANTVSQDFGDAKPTTPVTFTGLVYNDLNLDHAQQANEPGLAGWKFYVDVNNNSVLDPGEPTALSNSAGVFTFTKIPTGRYLVRPVMQTGWRMAQFVAWFATSFGKNVAGLNFPATQTTHIGGQVFLDANKNGVLNAGESLLSGFTVYLDANNNGKLDPGELSRVTNSNGVYVFDGIAAGTYVIRIVQQNAYTLSTSASIKLTLAKGQDVEAQNFGEHT